MIHEVILPKLGTNIEDGTIVEWMKSEGETVKKGDVLLMVETTKAVFEVEAECDGYLRRILHKKGAEVRFTEPVGLVTEDHDTDISPWFDDRVRKKAEDTRYFEQKRVALYGGAAHLPDTRAQKGADRPASAPGKVAATPAARRLMREAGVDPSSWSGEADVIDTESARRMLDTKRLAIYGAGLGARQVRELLRFRPDIEVVGIFDDNPAIEGAEVLGYTVLGGWDRFVEMAAAGGVEGVVISLHSEHRRKVLLKIKDEAPSVELTPLVDGRAVVSEGVEISPGAFIEAGAVIGPDTCIGEGVIVDLGAVVCHDSYIGANSHLSPGCAISGVVKLEENVLVGVGAAINSQVTIGRNTVITPGSSVMTDLPADVVVSGNPARVIGKSYRGA